LNSFSNLRKYVLWTYVISILLRIYLFLPIARELIPKG
jgi:hypothetical protein